MLEQIKNKSLDELKDLISEFSQDHASDDIQDDAIDVGDDKGGARIPNSDDDNRQSYSGSTGRSIMATFARRSNDNRSRQSELDKTISTAITVSSGSVFVPSASQGQARIGNSRIGFRFLEFRFYILM